MNSPERTIIHVGAPKTASTSLQRRLFQKHERIVYFGEDGDGLRDERETHLLDSMIFDDDAYYDEAACREIVEAQKMRAKGRTLIYSNADIMASRLVRVCAIRLRRLFPDASVLFVLRNQTTAIESYYLNHGAFLKPAPKPYFRKYVGFDDWMQFSKDFPRLSAIGCFEYDTHLKEYTARFGRDKVLVVLYEELMGDRPAFAEKLARLLKIDAAEVERALSSGRERPRITGKQMHYHRFRSKLASLGLAPSAYAFDRSVMDRFGNGGSANLKIDDKWREWIRNHFAPGNRWVAETFDLPLDRYGYCL